MLAPSACRGSRCGSVGRSGYVAMFLAELGDFAEAHRSAEITLRDRASIATHPWSLVNVFWQLAWAYALQGDLDRAKPLADQAIALCRQWGFSRSLGQVMSILGRILVLAGRAPEAVEMIEEGLRRTDAVGRTWLRCPRLTDLGEAYLRVGRVQDAAAWAANAVESARERGERGFEAWALRLQAEVALAAQPPDAAAAERTIARRRRSRARWRCAPSWRTATSASASSPGARASARRPRSTSPPRRRCTARWA